MVENVRRGEIEQCTILQPQQLLRDTGYAPVRGNDFSYSLLRECTSQQLQISDSCKEGKHCTRERTASCRVFRAYPLVNQPTPCNAYVTEGTPSMSQLQESKENIIPRNIPIQSGGGRFVIVLVESVRI